MLSSLLLACIFISLSVECALVLREDYETVPGHFEIDRDGRTAVVRSSSKSTDGRDGGHTSFGVAYCGDGSCYRSEYKLPEQNRFLEIGHSYWFGFTLMLPANATYADESTPNIYHFQLHGGDNIGRGPVFGLSIHNASIPLHWRIISAGDDRPSSSAPKTPQHTYTKDIGAIQRGHWEDFVVHINLQYRTTGYLQVWRNGREVVNQTGIATAYNDKKGPYIKMGAYVNKPFKSTSGVKTKWWGVNYWQLKVGKGESSFDEVSTASKKKR